MNETKPTPEAASLIAFALAEALLRRLVKQGSFLLEEAADIFKEIIANIRNSGRSGAVDALPVL